LTTSEEAKDKRLKKIYKKSLAEFNAQVEEQDGGCAICGRSFVEFTAFQDHDHRCCPRKLKEYCGKCCRGVLCFLCNKFVVGIVERQKVPVDKLLEYVNKWKHIKPREVPPKRKRK